MIKNKIKLIFFKLELILERILGSKSSTFFMLFD